MSVNEDLVRIADVDVEIASLSRSLKKLPSELNELKQNFEVEAARFAEVSAPLDELKAQNNESTATIEIALDTLSKYEEQIKLVKTQKEYAAAQKQIDDVRKLNDRLQNSILENRIKIDELEPSVTEARQAYDEAKAQFESLKNEAESNMQALQDKIEKLIADVLSTLEMFEAPTIMLYKRLIQSGKNPAIVKIDSPACSGCSMTISPQTYNIVLANPDKLHNCSHCRRFLVFTPSSD